MIKYFENYNGKNLLNDIGTIHEFLKSIKNIENYKVKTSCDNYFSVALDPKDNKIEFNIPFDLYEAK